jgi:hypothetical protein
MRTKTPADDELLAALPIYVDDTLVDPAATDDDLHLPDVRRLARELCDLPAVAPWTHPDPRPEPPRSPMRSQRLSSTFVRMVELDATRLRSLPDWWRKRARAERLRPTRRLSLDAPDPAPGNCWQARGELRPLLHAGAVPVTLTLWPHIEGWTKLTLDPLRRVHARSPYFEAGHSALDVLTCWLVHEL